MVCTKMWSLNKRVVAGCEAAGMKWIMFISSSVIPIKVCYEWIEKGLNGTAWSGWGWCGVVWCGSRTEYYLELVYKESLPQGLIPPCVPSDRLHMIRWIWKYEDTMILWTHFEVQLKVSLPWLVFCVDTCSDGVDIQQVKEDFPAPVWCSSL